jgi:hypothetical protein
VPKIDVGKVTEKLDSAVAKCKAGVAWADLLNLGNVLQFGLYNDRPEKDAETSKLIESFQTSGIVSMKETSAIAIIIELQRIQSKGQLALNFDDPDDVPELKLHDKGTIIVASGQHRLSALSKYHRSLADDLALLEKKRAKILASASGTKVMPAADDVVIHTKLREEIGILKGRLAGMGKWGIIVYDKGT